MKPTTYSMAWRKRDRITVVTFSVPSARTGYSLSDLRVYRHFRGDNVAAGRDWCIDSRLILSSRQRYTDTRR